MTRTTPHPAFEVADSRSREREEDRGSGGSQGLHWVIPGYYRAPLQTPSPQEMERMIHNFIVPIHHPVTCPRGSSSRRSRP